METYKEIINRIQALYSKGVESDETRLSSRHIYSKIKSVRKLLISQQIKKKQKISDWNFSVLPCVELIKVPATECSCLGNLGCDVYRTKYPLPKVLTDFSRHFIEFVMTVENGQRFEEITRQGVLYLKGNKYTANKPKYVFENGHLYFPLKKSPGIVKIKFLAEDALEAKSYPSFCEDCNTEEDCKPIYDNTFDLDGELVEPLIQMCVQELIGIFATMSEDTVNDSKDTQRTASK
jgi:hypothetical protein